MFLSIAFSNLVAISFALSTFAPAGSSIFPVICPLSEAGMNSEPNFVAINNVSTNIPQAIMKVISLCLTAQVRRLSYALSSLSNPILIGEYIFLNVLLCFLSFSLFSIKEHIIGVSVRAEAVDTIIMIQIIQPNCLNIIPAIPPIIVNGKNTASRVRVVAITATATSFVP